MPTHFIMLSFAYVALLNFYIIFSSKECEDFIFLEGENDTYGYLHINNSRLELMEGGPKGEHIYAANLSSLFFFNWFDRTVNDLPMDLVANNGDYRRAHGTINITFLCGFGGLFRQNHTKDAVVANHAQNLDLLYILFVIPLLIPLFATNPQLRRYFKVPQSEPATI